jgi:serine/threonine protein kinase
MTNQSPSETSGVAGTVPYMAPEQLRGKNVDVRQRHLLKNLDQVRDTSGCAETLTLSAAE